MPSPAPTEEAEASTLLSDLNAPVFSEPHVDELTPITEDGSEETSSEECEIDNAPPIPTLLTEIRNLTERNAYLMNINAALEAEILEVRAYQFQNQFVHEELLKSHATLSKETEWC